MCLFGSPGAAFLEKSESILDLARFGLQNKTSQFGKQCALIPRELQEASVECI
jgi:hypothetical protein